MGCTNSFIYNSRSYKDVIYTEKSDKRLDRIYLIKSTMTEEAHIIKEIPDEISFKIESRVTQIKTKLGPATSLFVSPIGIDDKLTVLKSERLALNGLSKCRYLKVEFFQRDIADEFNVKALKQRKFYPFEIWTLIYTLVFATAELEKNGFKLNAITFDDIVITNNSFKYFYLPFFDGVLIQRVIDELDYDQMRLNIAFIVLETCKEPKFGELPAFDKKIHTLEHFSQELESSQCKLEDELRSFVSGVLISNSPNYRSLWETAKHLAKLYHSLEYEVVDEEVVKLFS